MKLYINKTKLNVRISKLTVQYVNYYYYCYCIYMIHKKSQKSIVSMWTMLKKYDTKWIWYSIAKKNNLRTLIKTTPRLFEEQRSVHRRAEWRSEACWSHNPEVRGSKPRSANFSVNFSIYFWKSRPLWEQWSKPRHAFLENEDQYIVQQSGAVKRAGPITQKVRGSEPRSDNFSVNFITLFLEITTSLRTMIKTTPRLFEEQRSVHRTAEWRSGSVLGP